MNGCFGGVTLKEADSLIQHAETTLLQAELSGGSEREALLQEVKDALIRAEAIEPGSGSWLMACVNARLHNAPLCQKWLERAHAAGALPAREEMLNTPYLKPVRDQKWFQRFLRQLEA